MNEEKSFERFRLAFYELYCETPMGTEIAATDNWTEIFNMIKKWIIPFNEFRISHLKERILKDNFLNDYVPKSILIQNGFYIDEEIDNILCGQVFLLLNCKVKLLSRHSSIVCMFDSTIDKICFSDIHFMDGKSVVKLVEGKSTIKWMSADSKVIKMRSDSLVYTMTDSAIIEEMTENAEVREMYMNSSIKSIKGNVKILTPKENAMFSSSPDIYEDEYFASDNFSILDNMKFDEE